MSEKNTCVWMTLVSLLVLLATGSLAAEEGEPQSRGVEILEEIVSKDWARDWKGSTLEGIRLVKQKADLARPTGLPPVWMAEIKGPGNKDGMVMWEGLGEGRLVEFTLDAGLKNAGAVTGVPNLQQFPVKDAEGKAIASGCVPTAAGSVLSYWAENGVPGLRVKDDETPAEITERLRARLKMTPFPDVDGFTPNGMTLAGAFPYELAAVIRAEALARKIELDCRIVRFSFALLQQEIKAGRPVLLSCTVRVPHKPHLSWGHEVAGVAWTEIDDIKMVGVVDNFFPTKHPEAIRWIREDAFRSIIVLSSKRPELDK